MVAIPQLPELGEVVTRRALKVRELIVLLIDLSGSMGLVNTTTGTRKVDDVQRHLTDPADGFIQRLNQSAKRDGWLIALVTHDDHVRSTVPKSLVGITPGDLELRLADHGGTTDTAAGLKAAGLLAESFISAQDPDGLRRVSTVLLCSDGLANTGSDPAAEADRLKASGNIAVATAAYGAAGSTGEELLRRMASARPDGSPMFKEVTTGAELRDFFVESVSTFVEADPTVAP